MPRTRSRRPLDESDDRSETSEEAGESSDRNRMSTTPATQGDSNLGGGLLTEARAKEILAEQKFKVTSNGDVHNDIPMVVIHRGPVCVLGGAFELKTLEALVFWVKAQQAKRKATQ